jgi:hypothetical protein
MLTWMPRALACSMFALGIAVAVPQSANATPLGSSPFSLNDTLGADISLFTGTASGVLTFTLDLGSPADGSVTGTFAFRLDVLPGVSSTFINVNGPNTAGSSGPTSVALADFAFLDLFNQTSWTIDLGSAPLSIELLYSTFGDPPFEAQLSVNVAETVNSTPLPATMPLFASGITILGWFGLRRRQKVRA